jgi:pimeloyl-ACP methyl ester carboxylesterase
MQALSAAPHPYSDRVASMVGHWRVVRDRSGFAGSSAPMTHAVARFRTSDGVAIAFHRWGHAVGAPPVVLHHGFAANAQLNWVAPGIVQSLLDAGREVIAVDARGHGASDKPHTPSHYGESRMARDLIELLHHLAMQQVDLFGYSMGAVVALIVASTTSLVRRLVIGGVGEGVLLSGGVDLRRMDRDTMVAALRSRDASELRHPVGILFRQFAERTGADLGALAAQAARMHAEPIALDRIIAPTLVVAGEQDALAAQPARLAAALPDAHLQIVPGDHLEAVRAPLLLRRVLDFLNH